MANRSSYAVLLADRDRLQLEANHLRVQLSAIRDVLGLAALPESEAEPVAAQVWEPAPDGEYIVCRVPIGGMPPHRVRVKGDELCVWGYDDDDKATYTGVNLRNGFAFCRKVGQP